jgi:hypothetical protein
MSIENSARRVEEKICVFGGIENVRERKGERREKRGWRSTSSIVLRTVVKS